MFIYERRYRGTVQAVIFDWAGTTCDYGCCAPAAVFMQLFDNHGISVTMQQAREPMGMHKRDHIAAMLAMEAIGSQWREKHGHYPGDAEIDALFQEFVPMQVAAIESYSDLIPGTLNAVEYLRSVGIRIGSTTGYNDEMMAKLIPAAKAAGYEPDVIVTVSDVPKGRPEPWMALENAKQLGVFPMEAIVKVGDTPADILEGLNAGMWSVGVALAGNEVGMTEAEVHALDAHTLGSRLERAYHRLHSAGAHYVVDTIADVPPIVDAISTRMVQGDRP
jgi:phosphonoacetaldehyde hydrolase